MNMTINAAISRQINTTIGMMYSIDDIFESFLTGADGLFAVGVGDDVGVELRDDVVTSGGVVLGVF